MFFQSFKVLFQVVILSLTLSSRPTTSIFISLKERFNPSPISLDFLAVAKCFVDIDNAEDSH